LDQLGERSVGVWLRSGNPSVSVAEMEYGQKNKNQPYRFRHHSWDYRAVQSMELQRRSWLLASTASRNAQYDDIGIRIWHFGRNWRLKFPIFRAK